MSAHPMTLQVRRHRRTWVEHTMGMPVSITLRGRGVRGARAELAVAGAFAELRRADEVFSTYRPDSQVMRLQRGDLALEDALPEVREVLDLCQDASVLTGGAFTSLLPAGCGADRDSSGDLVFDPTGLVKGWAIARAGAVLAQLGGSAWCVNAGGDLAVGGHADAEEEAERPWRFGIEDPRHRGVVRHTVELRGEAALATSGTAQRGAHLFDPRSGTWPMRAGSVTVVGREILWADVWATACWVGGPFTDELVAARQPGYDVIRL